MSTSTIQFTEGFTGFFDSWESMRRAVGTYETDIRIYAENLLRLHTGKNDLNRRYKEVLGCLLLAGPDVAVLDLGGGLAVTYFAIKKMLHTSPPVRQWTVVDLPAIVAYGITQLADDRLTFSAPEADVPCDVLLASHTLQYLPDPYEVLSQLLRQRPRLVIFDELPLGSEVKFLVQKLPKALGGSELPCQILTHSKLDEVLRGYKRLVNKVLPDWCPVPGVKSYFRVYKLDEPDV